MLSSRLEKLVEEEQELRVTFCWPWSASCTSVPWLTL